MIVKNWIDAFNRYRHNARQVLSMNQRNLHYIYPHNARRHYPLADNKLETKELLRKAGVPVPQTYVSYHTFFHLRRLADDLAPYSDFVLKPAQGHGGGGILVISGKQESAWIGSGGKLLTPENLRAHIGNILFGVYSTGMQDAAIIEARVQQHAALKDWSPSGLADVRLIMFKENPVMAMMRLTTAASGGRANLHQGAVGVGVDLESGRTLCATLKGQFVDTHPDTGASLIGHTLPYWDAILHIGLQTARAIPLHYLGVDIALSTQGPTILEVNVRPGLEIQNANQCGLRAKLGVFK